MPRATLIYNPLAGPANLTGPIASVADAWRRHGWKITVEPTKSPGHATEIARAAAAAGHRLVIAAGGDGTLSEVANGLALTETALAPLPVGTANSFAKELHMPLPGLISHENLLHGVDALANGRIHRVDLGLREDGQGNGRYWMLWSGTGADGYLVHRVEPRPKWSKKLGPFGYAIQGILVAPTFPPVHANITVDGETLTGEYILMTISNVRLYAGEVVLNPNGRLDDGQFELWLFRGRGVARIARYVTEAMLSRHLQNPDVSVVPARNVTIETDPVIGCHADGERTGYTPLVCRLVPGALRLLVPSTAPQELFVQPGQSLA